MMSTKITTVDLFKIKVFWNERYDFVTSVIDVINGDLSRDSNHIMDIVMWPKSGNSSTSMREAIITSIL